MFCTKMSEWLDNQKRSNSSIRQLLKERIEKANPRRKLASEEAKRLAKLEEIAEKHKRGDNVQNRQLQTWLSEDEYAQFEAEWKEQLELREELKEKPEELKRYEKKLRDATFQYNRAEGYSNKSETKWAALELMLGTSSSVVALAKKMAKPETKTVTRTVAVPKAKIVTQQPQQQTTPKDTERTDFTPTRPQPPLPHQQDDKVKR